MIQHVPAIQSGTYGEPQLVIRNPSRLRRWGVVRGDALDGALKQPVITVFGDSITGGTASTNTTGGGTDATDRGIYRSKGFVAVLRRLFAARYGTSGEGLITATPASVNVNTYEDRVAHSGTISSPTVGPLGLGRTLTAGQTLTFTTTAACTQIDVIGWWNTAISLPFTYTVDGGGSVSGPTKTGTDTLYLHSITGLSDAVHTLVITGPATLRADIGGVICRRAGGVVVNRAALGGGTMSNITGAGFGAGVNQNRVINSSVVTTATDLAIVMLRFNDREANITPAAFQTNLQIFCNLAVAGGACVLLIPDPGGSHGGTPTYSDADYADAMKAISDATDHVAYADWDQVWGGYTKANALGLIQDQVHPKSTGHGAMGQMVFEALSRAFVTP